MMVAAPGKPKKSSVPLRRGELNKQHMSAPDTVLHQADDCGNVNWHASEHRVMSVSALVHSISVQLAQHHSYTRAYTACLLLVHILVYVFDLLMVKVGKVW